MPIEPPDARRWRAFDDAGYVRLGRLDDAAYTALGDALDDIMLGRADAPYDELLMQLDSSTGDYGDLGRQTRGFKGATLRYRKIQDLERTAAFRAYLEQPAFRTICQHVYGAAPIACFRAMAMIKPARGGTRLPWHQDRWRALDRDPLVTVWTALDDADASAGGLEVIPGSHRLGVVNPHHPSAFLSTEQATATDARGGSRNLDIEAGEVYLLHNWLLHRSGVNASDHPRRAFSVCYMDARTVDRSGAAYTRLFADSGSGLAPKPRVQSPCRPVSAR